MSDIRGALCLVLHGHLPYVLHHGSHPHGEAWLFEAAAETYLPLLEMIGAVALHRASPKLTVGLTPILLEQLANDRFKNGFADYLKERQAIAMADLAHFQSTGEKEFAPLAQRWVDWFEQKQAHFERIGRDIPAEFAARANEGHIEILTSNATHAYLPLLLSDRSIRGQMRAGVFSTKKRLGVTATGLWLPECAYRPASEHWMPPVIYKDARRRAGLETFFSAEGLDHFFVDTHSLAGAQWLGSSGRGQFQPASSAVEHSALALPGPLLPFGVASRPGAPACLAFARHPQVSEQVWSGVIGYPGSGEYLEFHRKRSDRGLRYWRVTSIGTDLGAKRQYAPEAVPGKCYEHAQHFCGVVRQVLQDFREQTGRSGVCVAPFDAELFGHWWHEGPEFLRNVILTLANDPHVRLLTSAEAIRAFPAENVLRLPEGSWGEQGNHSVWLNDRTRWIWEIEYRAEHRFLATMDRLDWPNHPAIREMLERAARQLLLLQASDWPFVIHTKGADDYGAMRFAGHATRFDRAMTLAEHLAQGQTLDRVQQTEIAEMDAHDDVFAEIDLRWWGED